MASGYAVGLAEVGTPDTAAVGGKGASLGELIRAGVPVPPGYVLTTAAFAEAMTALDPVGSHRRRIGELDPQDLDEVAAVTAGLRHRIARAPVPEPLCRTIRAWYRHLAPGADGPAPVTVRSSATSEDSAEASFAGPQDTHLWVCGEEPVLAAVRRCWASLYSVESVTYRLRRGLPEAELAMAVVIQQLVDPRCAGVMVTRSPLTGDRSVIAVEAVWGLGSALVSGEVTPDRFVVDKATGEVVNRAVARKLSRHVPDPAGTGVRTEDVPADLRDAGCLTDGELGELVRLGKRIEGHYRAPQDIEWAVTGDDQVYVLQSRPETVWAQRDAAAPIAPTHARALDHVLDRLRGRAA